MRVATVHAAPRLAKGEYRAILEVALLIDVQPPPRLAVEHDAADFRLAGVLQLRAARNPAMSASARASQIGNGLAVTVQVHADGAGPCRGTHHGLSSRLSMPGLPFSLTGFGRCGDGLAAGLRLNRRMKESFFSLALLPSPSIAILDAGWRQRRPWVVSQQWRRICWHACRC